MGFFTFICLLGYFGPSAGLSSCGPTINIQPTSQTACPGETVSFTVSASSGNGGLSYQWRKDCLPISGETSATLLLDPISADDYGTYSCVVSDSCGSITTEIVQLTAGTPLAITDQPDNISACIGNSATFSVSATGDDLSYQWRLDCQPIPGATSSSYHIASVSNNDLGSYDCVINNNCASLTSASAGLTIPNNNAYINGQTGDREACKGDNVVLALSVAGFRDPIYQWYKDGNLLPGENRTQLMLANIQPEDEGTYHCTAQVDCGTLVTDDMVITVTPDPVVTLNPTDQEACLGGTASFSAAGTGTGTVTYLWRRNGLNLWGMTNATLTITDIEDDDVGTYECRIQDDCGEVYTQSAELRLVATGNFSAEPQDQEVCAGTTVNFTAAAEGEGPFTYQWRRDCEDIPGATSATLSIANAQPEDTGTYACVITFGCGSLTTRQASLLVDGGPLIGEQPESIGNCNGADAVFSISAVGKAPLTYQWRKNGQNIPGATSTSYTIASPTSSDNGDYTCVVTSACGSTTSATASLAAGTPPAITGNPIGEEVCLGEAVSFTVSTSGSQPLTYQWRLNEQPITGATSATLAITNALASDAGYYDCIVSNSCGSVNSSPVLLSIITPPTIDTDPTDQDACLGDSVSFSVGAGGAGFLGYQWQKDGVDISGANSPSYAINSVTLADYGDYTCVVTNSCNASETSATATLSADASVTISSQPQSSSACVGDSANFSVVANGSGSLSYQWRKDGVAINGATSASYNIASIDNDDLGSYTCAVTDDCGTLLSSTAVLSLDDPPVIGTQPVSQDLCLNDPLSLSVAATGTGTVTYQWHLNGNPISGATNATYSLANIAANQGGDYSCSVSADCGSITSETATITVDDGPTITQQPASQQLCLGNSFSLSVASSNANSYQWYKNNVPINGATSATYSINSILAGDVGNYHVVLSNDCDSTTSNTAVLSIYDALDITSQPSGGSICVGGNINLSISATGSNISYQWKRNGSAIPGATNASYSLSNVALSQAGSYSCTISNDCGELNSNAANITVLDDPVITVQPQNQTACLGSSLTLGVATDSATSYQWYKDSVLINGATNTTYVINQLSNADVGAYHCVVSNSCGSTQSQWANVTVSDTFAITEQPESVDACLGETINLSVATDTQGLSYQWRRNGIAINGATSNTLAVTLNSSSDAGAYTCTIADSCSSLTSEAATVTLIEAPVITAQPQASRICPGGRISFSITATSNTTLSYQWRKDCVPIPGATSDTLMLDPVEVRDQATYSCVVSNACATVTSQGAGLLFPLSCGAINDPGMQDAVVGGAWVDAEGNTHDIDTDGDGIVTEEEAAEVRGILNLSGASIQNLNGIGAFRNITGLIVSGNNLHELPNEILELGELEELDASGNDLQTWPDFSGMPRLVTLDLGNNDLGDAPSGKRSDPVIPASVEVLILDGNRLTNLPDLSALTNLRELKANYNRLTNTEAIVAQNDIGSDPGDTVTLEHNLFNDCSVLAVLSDRASNSGSVLLFDPQLDFSALPNWNQNRSILQLVNNLDMTFSCSSKSQTARSQAPSR